MKHKWNLIFVCFFIFFFCIAGVCASDVNDNTVVSEHNLHEELSVKEDMGIIGESDDGTFSALQKKIDDAGNASTIVLENNYNYDDGFNKEGINIAKALTIDGNGYTIDGGGQSRIFNVLSDGVILKNIVFKNAHAEGNGGAICGNCTAISCTFQQNYANGDGGAIYNANAENCIFMGNCAEYRGGAIFNGNATGCSFTDNNYAGQAGGAIHTGDALNCIFTSNGAKDQGGAMYGGNAVGCTFENNNADNHGAAISNGNAINTTFTGNHVNYNGGAIYMGSATNCNFTGNYAWLGGAIYSEKEEQSTNCNFNSNWAFQGGAIYGNNVQYSISNSYFKENGALNGGGVYNGIATNCTFVNNAARKANDEDDGDGGAMYGSSAYNCTFDSNYAHDDGDGAALSHSYAENCIFKLNHAADLGGAIYYTIAVNCNFTENSASNAGGAMYQGNATNCIFERNILDGDGEEGGAIYQANAKNCTFIGNSAYHGGAMCANEDEGTFTADGCTFIGNSADGGGAIYRIDAVNCIFTNNTSTDDGGAMYYNTATNCTFITNHADDEGGAFYKATTYGCTFTGNTPQKDTFSDLQDLIDDAGDTLHLDYDYYFNEETDGDYVEGVEIDDDLTIDGNYRTIDARHMARIFKITDKSSVTINNLVLINGNYSTWDWMDYNDGGGAMIIFEDSSLTLNNVDFFNNTCDHYGGAIKLVEGSLYVNGGKFMDNTVYQDYAFGGAIACYGICPSIILTNASFIHNYANYCGGAILLAFGEIKIVGGEFFNNSAASGGAIRGWNTALDDSDGRLTSVSITGGTKFINNVGWQTADDFDGGGAIDVDGAYYCEIEDVEFINNSAGNLGGAILGVEASRLHLTGVKFINNSAPRGGAIFFACNDNQVNNCIFINNSADKGSAIFSDSVVNLVNNTINTEFPEIYVDNRGYITSLVNIRIMDNTTYEFFNPVKLNATLLSDDNGNLIYDEGLYFLVGDNQVSANYDEEKMNYFTDYITLDEGGEYLISANSDKYGQLIPQTSFIKIKVIINGSFTDLAMRVLYAQVGNHSLELPYDFTYIKEFDNESLRNGILINSSLFIDGMGHTINGSSLASIFHFCNNVTLKNINFANAYSANNVGGAVYLENSSAYAMINNCNFTNNTVLSSGGAIYANSSLTILNSNFNNNSAYAGGSIYAPNHVYAINCKFNDDECPVNGTLFLSFNDYSSQIELSQFTHAQGDGKYAIVNIGSVILHLNNISGSVFNEGNLTLHENNIGGTVYNYGNISNNTLNAVVINGETVNVTFMETVHPYATLVNHDGNAIFEPDFRITLNGESLKTGYDNNLRRYVAEYTFDFVCERVVSTNYPAESVINGKYVVLSNLSMFNLTVDEPSKKIILGENVTISVVMYDDKGRKLSVEKLPVIVNNKEYSLKIVNGTNSFSISGLAAGNYSAMGIYRTGDYSAYATDIFTVVDPNSKRNTTITSDVVVDNHNVTITVTVDLNATGFVKFNIKDKDYYYPVIKGQAVLVSDFITGNYVGDAQYLGDGNFNDNSTNFSFKVNPDETIISNDLIKIEKASDRFIAKFTYNDGDPLINTKVIFVINGIPYIRTTDSEGCTSLAINLVEGNYIITINNPVTREVKSNHIKVLSRFSEDGDLVKYFRNDSQYILKVLDDTGNPVKAGEVVTYNINGVFYNRTTNATGHVKLNINLRPGEYIITAEYKGCKIAHKVTVLPTLTGNDLTIKYGEPGIYEATLVDGHGKAYVNRYVGFNINGVLYQRKTDSNGVAKLNINLPMGKYIITAFYVQASMSNTITVIS